MNKEKLISLLSGVFTIFIAVSLFFVMIEDTTKRHTKIVESCNEKYGVEKWKFEEVHRLDFYPGQQWICVPKEEN